MCGRDVPAWRPGGIFITGLGQWEPKSSEPESFIANLTADLAAKAPLASPAFTGTPTLQTTPNVGDNTTKIASTAFVLANQGYNQVQSAGVNQTKASTLNFTAPFAVTYAAGVTQIAPNFGATATTFMQGNDARVVGAEQTANKGVASGYASLDATTHVPVAQIPSLPESQITNLTTDLAARVLSASPTFSGITGSVQCLHVNASGVVSGTGAS